MVAAKGHSDSQRAEYRSAYRFVLPYSENDRRNVEKKSVFAILYSVFGIWVFDKV